MNDIQKIHLMGIGGSGMAGVAKIASEMGYKVTGCDLESSTAYTKHIFKGHDISHIKDADLVVISPAVYYQSSHHPEFVEAKKRKILITWQEFLGSVLLKDKKLICIAGTHGKSTTTAMAGKMLIDNGFDPIVVVGANVAEWGSNSRFGKGEYAVIEADEFNNNFLNYSPEIIILNNIEFDHPDFFKSEKDVFESFKKFVLKLKGDKILIVNWEDKGVRQLLLNKSILIALKGFDLDKVEPCQEKLRLNLRVPGKHNLSNATMVYTLGRKLGLKESAIKKSLSTFAGIGRRMELIADKNGIKVYDDYAHHPTAIEATLEGARTSDLEGKMWVVVEPHGFNRTRALLAKYKTAFHEADRVLIGPIFQARDKETFGMSPQLIAEVSRHKGAKGFNSFEEIKDVLKSEIKPGDMIVVMGAGKSYLWAREIADLIK